MILRDSVTITDTGLTVPAEVQPLRTSEQVQVGVTTVTTAYRLFLETGVAIGAASSLTWRGRSFEVLGDVEQWSHNGRPHHQEATIQALGAT